MISLIAFVIALLAYPANAFLQPLPNLQRFRPLHSSTDLESEIKSMRAGAIKQELESYGISTRAFLEKSELVDALVQARKEGKTPVATSSTSDASTTTASAAETTATTTTMSPEERQEKLSKELEACKAMKVMDLKAELESYGISTASFFEKSEFVKAVAEIRVDGVPKTKKKKRRTADDDEEEVVTAKVEVITGNEGPKTKKTRDAGSDYSNPFSGGGTAGSDFGPFGGMGGGMDMGAMADMFKNIGGGGMGGGNPFGGAGGNPFGGAGMDDMMKQAQEAMKNPKVMAVIAKAQKNPKVMQAVQESMGNPAKMMSYMNDPDIGPIMRELQEAMM